MKFNKTLVALAAVAFPMMASAATSGATGTTEVQGGQVRFEGEVVNAACAVDNESRDKLVQMGQVRVADFDSAGTEAGGNSFTLSLVDCDPSIQPSAAISFQGGVDSNDDTALAINTLAGSAKGVGIHLYNEDGSAVEFNKASSYSKNLIEGTNVFNYRATYVSTDATVEPGVANAVAQFTVTYS
ncbi:fimbrial protein [Photobacterium leiognathi]|uniref:Type-1 fimbrial protein subunit A n=1 Tax=Photobacterium leiognathi subsp. mandapamensis TaxID=48408 RepID=A0A2T3KYV6_PHOLD|nr:fimbrial protein [Photobacterium leiognathi]PSV12974.1 type-1 fimbrial protein subunit A [Photobacterium leiognathi subsp. mandapamensis]PSW56706.1 type-1 fimbrial protein subunit A [Photobacterium leiognathi subsp. mandapamensis]